jgi:LysR family hydrogen peroxide-inducible transcriptional activator
MTLRDLRYLIALADHRHFGRAAEAVHVSQPTLSTQIRKLEDELGIALFERSPRNVLLTEAGERIVARARTVVREADEIKALARSYRDPESGTIRLGIFPTLGPYLLPHVVPRLRTRFPRLELLLVEDKTQRLVDMLRDGTLDCAVLAQPIHDDGLHDAFLFEEPFVLAVPSDHPLRERRHLTLDDLGGESLLLLEEGHCLRDQALEVCHLTGASERAGFRATSLETLRQMVAAHVGVTLLPVLAVKPPIPASPDIRLLNLEPAPPSRRIALYWRRSSALTDFLSAIAEVLRGLPASLLDPGSVTRAGNAARPGGAAPRRDGGGPPG